MQGSLATRWLGDGGPGFFALFLQRVYILAYGPQLKARLELQRKFSSAGTTGTRCEKCKVITKGLENVACCYCKRNNKAAAENWTGFEHPFFGHLGRIIIALGFPNDYFRLVGLVSTQLLPIRLRVCLGCKTFVGTSFFRENGGICCASEGQESPHHHRSPVIYCGQEWCRPEREGALKCNVCRKTFCSTCVPLCGVCGGPTACRKCRTRYHCEQCAEWQDYFCIWHAPPRHPHIPIYEGMQFLCDNHIDWDQEWRRLDDACEQCLKSNSYSTCENGHRLDCINVVCSHTDAYEAGDLRCEPCRKEKRLKIE